MSRVHAVIMAGGRGTRFWPASRESLPKQFLTAVGAHSLVRQTALRLLPLAGAERTWVVTNAAHVDLAARELPELSRAHIVGEPVGRNTAPCIALAALLALREDDDAILLVAPADHWIGDEDAFRATARTAIEFALKNDALVTFGIVPASPETGYGYIESGEEVASGVHRVARFTEKPDRKTAEQLVASGRHFWNSGIFVWKASVLRDEMSRHAPEIVKACERIVSAGDLAAAMQANYSSLPSISIDYALLEKSNHVYVVPARFPWSDIGSWDALASLLPQDAQGNATQGDALLLEAKNSFVRAPGRLVAILGVDDLIVVDTPDALLVCPKDRAQEVKKLVEELEKRGRRELL